MQRSHRPDLWPYQHLQVQLQANGEQQQSDAQISKLLQHLSARNAHIIEYETGCQKTNQWRKANQSCQEAQQKSQGDPANITQRYSDPFKIHGILTQPYSWLKFVFRLLSGKHSPRR